MTLILLERSAEYALEAIAGVTAADLDRPTPCPEWDLRTLLVHVADAADILTALAASGEQRFPEPPRLDEAAGDPTALARERIVRLLDTVRAGLAGSAEQVEWADSATVGGTIELAAHGWDIARACGLSVQMPPAQAAEVLALARQQVNDDLRRMFFGPEAATSPDTSAGDRFAAFLGRAVS